MKKIYLMAIIVFGFTTVIKAGDMEGLKGIDFANLDFEKMAEMEVAPVKAAVPANIVKDKINKELVGQDLVDKFKRVQSSLRRLSSNTTWLDSDIDRFERDARRIANSGRTDPFFHRRLKELSSTTNKHANDAGRIYRDIQNLLNTAVKSDELNKISRSMELDARDINNDARGLESSARNLEWAVRSIKYDSMLDTNPQWTALDITSNVRKYSWKVSDIYSRVRNLVRTTKP